jgi:putative hydrolase of the HAD superfamily
MDIQAVFFDMGGTIETFWYTPELRLRATPELRRMLSQAGLDLGINDQELCDVINSGWERYHKESIETMQEQSPSKVWSEYIFPEYHLDPEKLTKISEALMVALELNFFQREMRPEVPGVLEQIRSTGMRMGLISNVCSLGQVPQSLQSYGLLDYFNPLVLSSRYGRRKPDPAIFHYAANLAHVPTSECLYVGDRIARDIVGARRAGFKYAVQIVNEFDHGEEDEGAHPDARIYRMTELLDFIHDQLAITGARTKDTTPVRNSLTDAGDILHLK